jgi:hypothetical protein
MNGSRRCVYLGCPGPISIDPLPTDGGRMAVRHGTDGEAVTIMPTPRTDEEIELVLDIIASWVLRVHDYERMAG